MSRGEQGFTLIEILIALLIFGVVAIGTITVLGAATAGGFLDAFPTSFATVRAARDYTAATVYLHGLQEYVAGQSAAGQPVAADQYCTQPTSGGLCAEVSWPGGVPNPPSQAGNPLGYELNWRKVDLLVELWGWNGASYEANPACAADCLTRVESTLTWDHKGQIRTLVVQRFIR